MWELVLMHALVAIEKIIDFPANFTELCIPKITHDKINGIGYSTSEHDFLRYTYIATKWSTVDAYHHMEFRGQELNHIIN